MLALAALRMVWASRRRLDGGGYVGNVVREEAAGDARPSPYRVLSVAPGRVSRRSTCSRSGK